MAVSPVHNLYLLYIDTITLPNVFLLFYVDNAGHLLCTIVAPPRQATVKCTHIGRKGLHANTIIILYYTFIGTYNTCRFHRKTVHQHRRRAPQHLATPHSVSRGHKRPSLIHNNNH